MAKVLFFNSPLYGHALPTFAVVQELVARGEEVIYYLTDEFAEPIKATGATFRSYKSTVRNNRPHGRLSHFLVEECQYVIPQIIQEVRSEKPDYVIYEQICLWGLIVGRSLQTPVVACSTGFAVNDHFSPIPYLPDIAKEFALAPFKVVIDTLNDLVPLADICVTNGLPPIEQDINSIFSPTEELNISFVSRFFQRAGETFDDRFIFIGPPIAFRKVFSEALDKEILASSSIPVLYISLGTIYNAQTDFYKICFQAFGKQPWRVITAIGKQVNCAELEPIPENFLLRATVPQLDVLQQATIFITHGGMNSIMEALYYGVPMVVLPQMPEQAMNGRRIEELGLGIVLDNSTVTASALLDAVHKLLRDPSLRERVKHAQAEVQASGGAQRAVDAILQFIAEKQTARKI